jgi:hypothetical protein
MDISASLGSTLVGCLFATMRCGCKGNCGVVGFIQRQFGLRVGYYSIDVTPVQAPRLAFGKCNKHVYGLESKIVCMCVKTLY